MHLTRLGKKSFRPICYFQAEIQIDDSKFETSIFFIKVNSVNFDIIISTDIYQGTLTVSSHDVKINIYQNDSKNSLVNGIK